MADDKDDVVLPGKGEIMAADTVTVVNGVSKTAPVKAERVRVVFGAPGHIQDVDEDHPLPAALIGIPDLPEDAATETTLAALQTVLVAVLTELTQKFEAGQLVGLDSSTLEALETISVANFPADPATQTTLAAVLAALGGTLVTAPATAGDVTSTLTDGRKTVSTAGSAVAISASLACRWVCVTALKSNTDVVNVGGSGVLAAAGSATGTPLSAGESVTIPISDASLVYVDSRVDGEGVSFMVGA